jgi:oxygen-dependent protoporphyrinogen oxidase
MIASGRRARADREARESASSGSDLRSTTVSSSAGSDGVGGRGKLTSFRNGLETLPRALAARGRAVVRCGAAVEHIDRGPDGEYLVRLPGETIRADALVVSCEAFVASRLLWDLAPDLAADLAPIQYPPVAVVGVGYHVAAARGVPRGFGVLVPRDEGYRVLGVLWESYIFADRSPDQCVLLRAMLGGAVDPEAGAADEETLLAWTFDDLRRLLGIESAPRFTHVHRWERAIPQYELGHGERVRRIESAAARRPGLFLAGNALHGVAFGKAAAAGLAAGEAAAAFVAARRERDVAPA